MISCGRVSGGMLGDYYKQEDYYFKNEQVEIVGSGKELYDIKGEFTKEQFEVISGDRELKAIDVTFSMPKGVSIAYGIGTQKVKNDIDKIQNESIKETLDFAEKAGFCLTRIKTNGQAVEAPASGLTGALFNHVVSRDLDPERHTHCLIANGVVDREGKQRHLEAKMFYKYSRKLGTLNRAVALKKFQNNHYQTQCIDGDKALYDLKCIDEKQRDKFSSGKQRIEKYLQKKGWADTPKNRARAEQLTKPKKHEVDHKKIEGDWKERAIGAGINLSNIRGVDTAQIPPDEQLFKSAISNLDETNAVFTKLDVYNALASEAIAQNKGVDFDDMNRIYNDHAQAQGLVKIPGQVGRCDMTYEQFTTERQLDAELNILDSLAEGKGKGRVFVHGFEKQMANYQAWSKANRRFELKGEQVASIKHILNTPETIVGVQGYAGTGKTTMLQGVFKMMDPAKVTGLSLQGAAAETLERETGVKSDTIDTFLAKYDGNDFKTLQRLKGGMMIMDEASMTGSKHMSSIINACKKLDCKLVLVGDKAQFQSVQAGKPFEILQAAGMATTTLKDITRQKDEDLREAVINVTNEDMAAALEKIDKKGCIKVIKNKRERLNAMSIEFVRDHAAGKSVLMITGTNADRHYLNNEVRFRLIKSGHLKGIDQKFNLLDNKDKKIERNFQAKDKIVFTHNDKRLGVKNNNTGRILKIDGRSVTVKMDGTDKIKTIDTAKYRYLDHGYALSTYKSQGQTVDKIIYNADSRGKMLSRNEFYVGISREKYEASVYTDDKERLAAKIERKQEKTSALDAYNKGLEKERMLGIAKFGERSTYDLSQRKNQQKNAEKHKRSQSQRQGFKLSAGGRR